MNEYEIMEYIKDYCNDDGEQIIQTANELLGYIATNPIQFVNNLDNLISKYAEENERCSCCGNVLTNTSYCEKLEAYGSNCNEEFHESYCNNMDCEKYGE